jgi:hypothetical protein|tara:strand:+ start:272 stop:451 length:180 start_codon:yes stop_codon:yes gene_type:complete
MSLLTATEVNTGGGSMVTIIESSEWNYILVTSDEAVAVYQSQQAFWDGEPALESTYIKS